MSTTDKKALIFAAHFHPHVGGVERYTMELWSRMLKKGWKVCIVTTNTNQSQSFEDIQGLKVFRLPCIQLIKSRVPVFLPSCFLLQTLVFLHKWQPKVIVTNTRFFPTSVLGIILSRIWGVPSLHIDHGSSHISVKSKWLSCLTVLFDKTIGKWVLQSASKVVGCSQAVSKFLETFGLKNVEVLYNGVSCEQERKTLEKRKSLGIKSSDIVVTYVGRLIKDKGILILIEAFKRLKNISNIHLVIAGDGDQMLEAKAKASNETNIHFLGYITSEEVSAVLKESNIFVHPSNYPEGLPTSILEAAICELAVIATPAGGTCEIIPSSELGSIIPPNDVEALQKAMERLIKDTNGRIKMGKNIKAWVNENFDWERIAERAEMLISKMLYKES